MKGYEPSLLEKLFDEAPHSVAQGKFARHTLEQFKESVALDVEALLNSRLVMEEHVLKEFPHCQASLMTYGLRDVSSRSLASSVDRTFICTALEKAITLHETRLKDIRVSLDEHRRASGGLRFSISAMLIVHPAREPVSFDALLQPSTLQYRVSKTRRLAVSE